MGHERSSDEDSEPIPLCRPHGPVGRPQIHVDNRDFGHHLREGPLPAVRDALGGLAAMSDDIETINDQMVGVNGDDIVVLVPKQRMTPEEAIRHAAWLVAMCEPHMAGQSAQQRFDDVYQAVINT